MTTLTDVLIHEHEQQGMDTTDELYNAVETLVETIYRYEGGVSPPDSIDEARDIAAGLIGACAEGQAVEFALLDFWNSKNPPDTGVADSLDM